MEHVKEGMSDLKAGQEVITGEFQVMNQNLAEFMRDQPEKCNKAFSGIYREINGLAINEAAKGAADKVRWSTARVIVLSVISLASGLGVGLILKVVF